MKSRLFLLIIFIISCDTNSINNPENSDEIIGIEMTIAATSFVDWEYYRVTD